MGGANVARREAAFQCLFGDGPVEATSGEREIMSSIVINACSAPSNEWREKWRHAEAM